MGGGMSSHDEQVRRHVKAFLNVRHGLDPLSKGAEVQPVGNRESVVVASARAERRRRFGQTLLLMTPVSMGCAVSMPTHDWFRWIFAAVSVIYAAWGVWQINRSDLD